MWRGDNLYFTSDRNDGTMNLYMKNLKSEDKPVQLTFSKLYDVKYPSIGPNHIVYQQEGFLNLYDLNRGKTERLKIDVPTDGTILREKYIDPAKYTGNFTISPQGKRAVIDIRGELISFPAEEGIVYNLTNSSGSREKDPVLLPD
jgi:tricorn protease